MAPKPDPANCPCNARCSNAQTCQGLCLREDGEGEFDDEDDDLDDDELADMSCGLGPDGQCLAAGSEYCDFECPNRDSELFAGSAAYNRAHGIK